MWSLKSQCLSRGSSSSSALELALSFWLKLLVCARVSGRGCPRVSGNRRLRSPLITALPPKKTITTHGVRLALSQLVNYFNALKALFLGVSIRWLENFYDHKIWRLKIDVPKQDPMLLFTWSDIHGVTIAPSLPNVEQVPTPADLNSSSNKNNLSFEQSKL